MEKALVKDFMRSDRKAPDGDIGIEIEVEASGRLPLVDNTWWKTKSEQSLRNGGLEYITRGALPVDTLMFRRIEGLTSLVDTKEAQVDKESHRTSVHIHHNVTNYTPSQLWTSITAYWLLENLLFKACGEEREGNHFCLRLKDAEALILRYVSDELKVTDHPFITLDTDNVRYSGINLNAINRFGSVELRGMRGTVDPQLIHDWSLLTHSILKNAKNNFKTPESLLDMYFDKGWKSLKSLLWEETKSLDYLLKHKDIEDLIDENAFTLANVMYSCSWSNYDKIMNKKAELLKSQKDKKSSKKKMDDSPWMSAFPAPDSFSIPTRRSLSQMRAQIAADGSV